MAQTVKLPDAIMEDIREEAALQSRSLASQVVHWINLGRQLEATPGIDMAHIRAALRGELSPDALNGAEQDVWLEEVDAMYSDPSTIPGLVEKFAALEAEHQARERAQASDNT